MELVAADIGGTHARFALARLNNGTIALAHEHTFDTADYASLQSALRAYEALLGRPLPQAAALAVAGPIAGDVLRLTNSPWTTRIAALKHDLGLTDLCVVNDFAAIAYAVDRLGADQFAPVCGPDLPLPPSGPVSIIGPGTGLGVALLLRAPGRCQVIATEGGHIDFAPLDPIEDRMLSLLRERLLRVSAERIVSGPGLANIYAALAAIEAQPIRYHDDVTLWSAALAGEDALAVAALERFCLCFGAVAGDIALAQGARAVVIAGGVGLRLRERLGRSGFPQRFTAKGRFESMMAAMPVKLVTHPQPGLIGAAAAFYARNDLR